MQHLDFHSILRDSKAVVVAGADADAMEDILGASSGSDVMCRCK